MMYAFQVTPAGEIVEVLVGDATTIAGLKGGDWTDTVDLPGLGYLYYDGAFYAPWVGTTNASDVYDLGAWRWHERNSSIYVWENITINNAFEPGTSGWRNRTGEWPQWFQPAGAQDAFQVDDQVSNNGGNWLSRRNANTSEPGTSGGGWLQVGDSGPYPWLHVGNEGYPTPWQVTHNGRLWSNPSAGNFWEPGVAIWVDEGPL